MIYALIGAVVVGLTLGLLGSGGAILTTPILVLLLRHPEKQAIAESLIIVGVIALWGAITSIRTRQIDLRAAIPFAIGSIPAAFLGARLGHHAPGPLQLIVLALLMLTASILMLRAPKLPDPSKEAPNRRHAVMMFLVGAGVGTLTGFTGIGGGFLFVPALVLVAHMPMRLATGTSLALIALNCAAAIVPYLSEDVHVDASTLTMFCVLGIVGASIGRHWSGKVNQGALRKAFGVFILGLGAYMLWTKAPLLLRGSSPQKQTSGAQAPPVQGSN